MLLHPGIVYCNDPRLLRMKHSERGTASSVLFPGNSNKMLYQGHDCYNCRFDEGLSQTRMRRLRGRHKDHHIQETGTVLLLGQYPGMARNRLLHCQLKRM